MSSETWSATLMDGRLSYGQKGLWFLERLGPEGAYNIAVAARVRGKLDAEALRHALERLVERHDALRTAFPVEGGEPVRRVLDRVEIDFKEIDPQETGWSEERLAEEAYRPFSLEHGPLLRVRLLGSVLLLSIHHIVADFASLAILARDLGALYYGESQGEVLPPVSARYDDFVRWQEAMLAGRRGERSWAYWREALAGVPDLDLPTDHPRPPVQTWRGWSRALEIPAAESEAVRSLAAGQGATLFTALMAAFQAQLGRYSGQRDFAVGSPTAGRIAPEHRDVVGYFVNPVALRADLSGDPGFSELLDRVRRAGLSGLRHAGFPFALVAERLRPERDPARSPLFQAVFTFQRLGPGDPPGLAAFALGEGGGRIRLGGLKLESLSLAERRAQFDLTLRAAELPSGGIGLSLEVNAALFDAETAGRMLGHLRTLLQGAVAEPGLPISALPLLTSAERRQLLVDWNVTPAPAAPELLHRRFEEQAGRTPDAEALVVGTERLSYGELNRRANRLARHLRSLGVGPEVRVGVRLKRSADLVVALLAVLKAGGAYVPLDPAYPEERLTLMAEDSGAALVISEPLNPASQNDSNLDPIAVPENLAYLIYTSGSTGRPKAVAIEHRSASVMVAWARGVFTREELAGVLASTSTGFDLSVFELFVPLSWGGRVILTDNVLEVPRLPAAAEVTLVNTVPAALAELVRNGGPLPSSVRTVNLAGEPVPPALAEAIRQIPGVERLYNLYGPSEDTTYSTIALLETGREVTIGRPVDGTRAYVLDEAMEPLPVGVPGELYLAGAGLARGYLGRPELTAERFVPDPFGEPGDRLYRTGDLVRWRPDGELDILGRIDHQVKIRGFRVELGEIEAALARHPGVREAVVVARDAGEQGKRLVAYLAGAVEAVELRDFLRRTLPEFMVPSAFVFLDALPLSPNGKVDRKALPEPSIEPAAAERPGTPLEDLLAGVFAEVLGVERVGLRDDFFDLGGHSLLATRAASRISRILGTDVPVSALFLDPTVAGLAVRLAGASLASPPPLVPVPREGDGLPLSFAQSRLWFLDRLQPDLAAYNIPGTVRLTGPLDVQALAAGLGEIQRRHETLRTVFPLRDGEPVQLVEPPTPVPLPVVDLAGLPEPAREREAERLAAEEARTPFDLARGPVWRVRLLRLAEGEHRLAVTLHHIAADGWSLGIFLRELTALYTPGSPPLPDLPVQYADWAAWQRGWLQGETLEGQLAYWRRRLAGLPVLDLPADRPRPGSRDLRGAVRSLALGPELAAGVERLARSEGTTLFMAVLGLFQALLARYTGEDAIPVGSPVANRRRVEAERLIGFFVNTLVLDARVEDDPPLPAFLARVREACLGAYAHQDVPFELLVEALHPHRDLSQNPLFQVMLVLEEPLPELRAGAVSLAPRRVENGTAKLDLTLAVTPLPGPLPGGSGGGWRASAEYAVALFDPATIDRLLGHFRSLIEGAVADPSRRLSELPLLTAPEREQILVAWNDTGEDLPRGLCLHDLVAAQAARTPNAEAVVDREVRLTYGDLSRRAGRLARHLRALGVGPEVRVGIRLPRSADLVVAVLAVLEAGGAYVPIDPKYPQERQDLMLEDSGAAVVISSMPSLEEDGIDAIPAIPTPENLAYLIYTSGSTGRPKAVAIEHRSAVTLVQWALRTFPREDLSGVLFATSVGFDLSIFEMFVPLAAGGRVIVAEDALELPRLAAEGVTLVNTVPSAMAELVRGTLPVSLRVVNLAGEPLQEELVERIHTHSQVERVYNLYGPSEDTTYSTFTLARPGRPVTIGRPIANTRAWVVDRRGQPLPAGVPGELWLGGEGLARGYLGRPELTAERFIPDPFSGDSGARLYRTGDLVRWRRDGELQFLGRTDHQVKIRGFRVELGEVEAVLVRHPGVREAAVLALSEKGGDGKRLAAYVVPKEGAELDPATLRVWLRERLPDAFVPTAWVALPALPLSPNGKVDRRALARIEPEAERPEAVEPRTPVEEALAAVWREVLGVERVGVHDDFFDLGGHSLLATRLIARLSQAFGADLPVSTVFQMPTVAALSEVIERIATAGAPEAPPLRPVLRPHEGREDLPLSFAQHRLWFLDRLQPDTAAYNLSGAVHLTGPLDVAAFAASLGGVQGRHEVLRTVFPVRDGEPVQLVGPPAGVFLPVVDLGGLPAEARESEADCLGEAEARTPFNLAQGPVWRARLLRLGDEEHRLVVNLHHAVADGWSLGLLLREAADLYGGASLPGLPVQYADYTVWQRGWLQGEALERQLAWWRERLTGLPVLELPADRPRPAVRDPRGAVRSLALPPDLAAGVSGLARREGATLFMALLAAFQGLLARYTGEDTVPVGSPVANRQRIETERLIGLFVNTLVLAAPLGDDPPFAGFLARVRAACLGAYTHQDLPFERLVEELHPGRDLSRNPLFQVTFQVEDPAPEAWVGDLRLVARRIDNGTAKLDLAFSVEPLPDGGWLARAEHATALFDPGTIDRLLAHWRNLLAGAVANPGARLSDLPLLDAAERGQILAWSTGLATLAAVTAWESVVEKVEARAPEALAVASPAGRLTYGELNGRADRIAAVLRDFSGIGGIGPEVAVGLYAGRSAELVTGALAVLKAGGAYVPLDPSYPEDRLAFMAAESGMPVLLTAGDRPGWLGDGVRTVDLTAELPAAAPDREVAALPESTAYVLYTSGSTGRPKGVQVPHAGLANLVRWHLRTYGVSERDRATLVASPAFDASVWEMWPYLAAGASLHVPDEDTRLSPERLRSWLDAEGITLCFLPTALAEQLLDLLERGAAPPSSLRALLTGGDRLQRAPARDLPFALVNHYGPTENSVVATWGEVDPLEARPPSIGRPLDNVQARVLGPRGEPVPAGVAGELCLGGRGLARGYLGRPDLTAERFVPDPFGDSLGSAGGRLYRTGDRVRFLTDGRLEFLGRLDQQVKLRGVRVELGEIEATLLRHPGVREAAAVVRTDGLSTGARLVAYVVTDTDPADLRSFLRERLPDAMIPSAWVVLPALPLSASGKVDRRALPPPSEESEERAVLAPRTPTEERLAALWSEVLGVERIGVDDDFFELGGHSLLAVRATFRTAETLGVEVPVSVLFQNPTVAALAGWLESGQAHPAAELAPEVSSAGDGPFPLSLAQQRLWLIERLDPGNPAYNQSVAVRLSGDLRDEALAWSLGEILRRHEPLRTVFAERGGEPVQIVQPPPSGAVLPRVDLSALPEPERGPALRRAVRAELGRPFDLERGPMARFILARLGAAEHVLAATFHHIASDGWSMEVFFRELVALYGAAAAGRPSPLPELPLRYAGFALWQRRTLTDDVLEEQLAYWRRELAGVPVLELPTDRLRPGHSAYLGHRGATVPAVFPPGLIGELRALGRGEGITLFAALLAGFTALMGRYSGQDDLPVGITSAGRGRRETEGMIGFFVNTLVIRSRVADDPGFLGLARQVRERILAAQVNQDVPFERVVEELQPDRDPSLSPLFQVMLTHLSGSRAPLRAPGLEAALLEPEVVTAKFDLLLTVDEWEGGVGGHLEYRTDLFEAATAARLLRHLVTLLEGAAANPSRRLWDLPLLTAGEREQMLIAWNDTRVDLPAGLCLHELVTAQAARTPGAEAVVDREVRLTYEDLEIRTDALARRLRARGVRPEVRVGIRLGRTADLLVAILAVLKAGGVYVPIDPKYPQERQALMLEDSGAEIVISSAEDLSGEPADGSPLAPLAAPENLAYLIYTSGSTGRPKAVAIEHRNAVTLVQWALRTFPPEDFRSVLFSTSVCFDLSVFEMFVPLAMGGRVVVAEDALELRRLAQSQEVTHEVTLVNTVPSAMSAITELASGTLPASLRVVCLAGEPLKPDLAERIYAHPQVERLYNLYGPSEDTTYSTFTLVRRGEPVTIGRPIANSQAYVVDRRDRPAPVGVPGELWLGGDGLARGYLGRPELTAEKFIPDPFGDEPGARLYRTGDLVRWLPNARLHFLGRIDHQVKVRGFRIELGEIESALTRHPRVGEAAVVVHEGSADPGDKRLVAYLVPRRAGATDAADAPAHSAEESARHVGQWQGIWDDAYARGSRSGDEPGDSGDPGGGFDPAFDIQGWNSSYTGQPIPAAEMHEWVDHTAARLLALPHRRVLEVGCGTGLLLFRVAPHAGLYRATDFSATVLDHLRRFVGRDLPQVTLERRAADDWRSVEPGSLDLVILNSVAQYFPGTDYLARVLEGAVRAVAPGGAVFVGDVRSLPLLEALHLSVALHQASGTLDLAGLRRRVARHVADEEELVVEPAFFFALARRLPRSLSSIRRVQVLLKRGAAVNELTRFRYDVVLHVGEGEELPGGHPYRLDWRSAGLSLANLEARLAAGHHEALLLERIPNARLAAEAAALDLLAGAGLPAGTVAELRREIAGRLEGTRAVDPEDLWRLAERLGYDAELTWSRRGGTDGLFTALLRRQGAVPAADPFPDLLAAGRLDRPWSAYGNDPMRGEVDHDFLPDLRHRLAAELPEYMIPSAFVVLEALPLTPNGKVDRRALSRLTPDRGSREEHVAPRTPVEETLAKLWEEVLGEERTGGRVGVHDNFFDLGGHSLIASRLSARVRSTLGVELPLRTLFEAPTVAGLAERLEGLRGGRTEAIHRQPRRPGETARFPVSFSQLREWILDRLEPGTAAYNIPSPKRITGPASVPAFDRAFQEIVRRHESLRTTFEAGRDEPLQVVAPHRDVLLPLIDLEGLPEAIREPELRRLLEEDLGLGFDLEAGPLLRVRLVRLAAGAAEDHALLLTMHHIISDGWSSGVFSRELATLYEAFSQGREARLPELPLQYPDYAVWQRDRLQGERLEELLGYWRGQLAGAPPLLELPTDRPRPAVRTARGGSHRFTWPAAVAEPLKALAAEGGVSLFMALLASFQALLARLSGQDDVAVGTFSGNRGRTELEGLIGFFINTLALRTDLSGEPSFHELLGRVREVTLGAYAHQEIPFEKLLESLSLPRDPSRTPVFQTMLVLHNFPQERVELSRITLEPLPYRTHRSNFDLTLWVMEDGGGFACEAEYSLDLFEEATVVRMMDHLRSLIEAAAADPGASLWSFPLVSAAERAQILGEWSRRIAIIEPEGSPLLHVLFEAQAARSPEAVAVETGAGERLSYAELNARADRLARYLRSLGVGPESRVGLAVERSPEMLVGMLGVLKAGGAYVPLDPAYPQDRLAYMLEDSGATLLLTQERLVDRFPTSRIVLLDAGDLPVLGDVEPVEVHPEKAAYVIYTSGSTGKPKGVVVSHRSIAAYARTARDYYAVTPADRVLQFGSISFDTSAEEIYPTLIAGATLVLRSDEMALSMSHFLSECARLGITLLALQTAFWHEIVAGLLDGLPLPLSMRLVAFGGEAALLDRLHAWRRRVDPRVRLVNTYGPTEATIVSTYRELAEPEDDPEVPIGRAIPGARTYVLDRRYEPVPAGVKGELMIGGVGVARGYLGRPDLTAERFVPDPWSGVPGARLYRTGDLARFRMDGDLLFSGRADRQLKLRGYRIEPGEVEAALRQHPALHDAVVDLRGTPADTNDKRLVAWMVPREGQPAPPASELRTFLRERLPEPMVPSAFLPLAALPLTPSGKVDRRSLPDPEMERAERPGYAEPETGLERTVAGIFRDLLRVDRIGRNDNFFELGGHSLLVVRAHQRLREALGREIPVVDLFRFPTVALLARHLGHLGGGGEEKPAFERVQSLAGQQKAAQAAQLRRKEAMEKMRRPGGPKR